MDRFDEVMNDYFGIKNEEEIYKEETQPEVKKDFNEYKVGRYTSEGNISTIDDLADIIKIILDTALGDGWGTFKPKLEKTDTIETMDGPIITYDINHREVSENTNLKPQLMDTIKEEVNGVLTGDAINVYRQWFDCIVEFDIWGRNSLETRILSEKFERLLNAYIGNIKKHGVSEMFFMNEVPATISVNYRKDISMRPIMYFVKLERIQTVRVSTINKIETKVNAFIKKRNASNSDSGR